MSFLRLYANHLQPLNFRVGWLKWASPLETAVSVR